MDTLDILCIAFIAFSVAAVIVMEVIIERVEAERLRQRRITLYKLIMLYGTIRVKKELYLEKQLHDESARQLNELKRRNTKAAQEAQRVIREREK